MSGELLEALGFFVGAFVISALMARSAPWQVAQYKFMYFEMTRSAEYDAAVYDPDRIERQVKRRTLTREWLIATLIGSSLVGSFVPLMPSSPLLAIYLMIAGVTVIMAFSTWQAVKLFQVAVSELGIDWPPPGWDQEVGG